MAASSRESVPVEHLDYAFVNSCTDGKELERVLKVLRSGKEGHYPQLIAATEEQLRKWKPKSLLLRKDQSALQSSDLPPSERQNILADLENWSQEMSAQEGRIKLEQSACQAHTVDAPIRGQMQAGEDGPAQVRSVSSDSSPSSGSGSQPTSDKKPSRIKAYDYRGWDKFDPDTNEETPSEPKAPSQVVPEEAPVKRSATVEADLRRIAEIATVRGLATTVSLKNRTRVEIEHMSRISKEKGNESYRAGDYEEAVVYYTHSLGYSPNVPSFNNRSLAALKLRMYHLAEEDACQVLSADSTNTKALLRRAEARQYLWKYHEALADVRAVLATEPRNKAACDMLSFLEKETRPVQDVAPPTGSSVEDDSPAISSASSAPADESHDGGKRKKRKKGKTLTIHEISGDGHTPPQPTSLSPGKKRKGKSPTEPPKCKPKSAALVQPIGILKRSSSASSPMSADSDASPTSRRSLHWADTLVSTSPTASYSPMLSTSPKRGSAKSPTSPTAKSLGKTSGKDTSVSSGSSSSPSSSRSLSFSKGDSAVGSSVADSPSSEAAAEPTTVDGSVSSKAHTSPEKACSPQTVGQASVAEPTTTPKPDVSPPAPKDTPLPTAVLDLKEKGNSLFKNGDYHSALTIYTKALKTLDTEPGLAHGRCVLLNNRAACHIKLGNCSSCIQDCTASLDLQVDNAKAWMRRGDAHRIMERFEEAYADFQQVVLINPSMSANAQSAMTRLVSSLSDRHGPAWRTHLPKRPAVRSSAAHSMAPAAAVAASSEPVAPSTPVTTKNLQTSSGDAPAASLKTSSNSEAAPSSLDSTDLAMKTSQTSEEVYQTVKQRGNDFVKQGQWTEALYCYSSCVKADSSNPVGFTNRALCYLKLNKPEEAEVDCMSALKIDPKNVKAMYRKALAQKALHRYGDCVASLRQVIALDRSNTAALKEVMAVTKLAKEAGQDLLPTESSAPKQPTAGKDNKAASPKSPGKSGAKGKKKTGQRNHQRVVVKQVDRDSDADDDLLTVTREVKSSGVPQKAAVISGDTARKTAAEKTAPRGRDVEILTESSHTLPDDSIAAKSVADVRTKATSSGKSKPDGKRSATAASSSSKSPGEAKKQPHYLKTEQDLNEYLPEMPKVKYTPYEFMQSWAAVEGDRKVLHHCNLLGTVNPKDLPGLISNKMDYQMLADIVAAVEGYVTEDDQYRLAYDILKELPNVKRYSTFKLFLSVGDKIRLNKVIREMRSTSLCQGQYTSDDLDVLEKALDL